MTQNPYSTITCPSCGHTFSLSDVHKHELEDMRAALEKKIESETKQKAFAWAQKEIEKKMAEEQEKQKQQSIELEMLRKKNEDAREKEIAFLKERQVLESRAKDLELEKAQAIAQERKKIEKEVGERSQKEQEITQEKMRLEYEKHMAEMQKKLEMTQRAVDEASRKANQGSMQIQGEIQEESLKTLLTQAFSMDRIDDVEKGIKGADIIQHIISPLGQEVGIIAWESKNTKDWKDEWVGKLMEDRVKVGASVAIIVTQILPRGVTHFGLYKNIWVTTPTYILPLTTLLRTQIIEIHQAKSSLLAKDEKMEVIYAYLTSSQFGGKMTNIIESFKQMKEQVEEERRAFEKRWKTREQLLSQVLTNTAGFYGDLQGLIGASKLPKVDYLELGE